MKIHKIEKIKEKVGLNPKNKEIMLEYAKYLRDSGDQMKADLIEDQVGDLKKGRKKFFVKSKKLKAYISERLTKKYPILQHRFESCLNDPEYTGPDKIHNLIGYGFGFQYGVIRQIGITNWPKSYIPDAIDFMKSSECEFVNYLEINGYQFDNFDFLDNFKYLEEFFYRAGKISFWEKIGLAKEKVTDVSKLVGSGRLKNLKELNLRGRKLTNYESLVRLGKLESLTLRETDVSDISFLKNIKNLAVLSLENAKNISDFSVLSELESLEFINLQGTQIESLDYLWNLPNLWEVWSDEANIPKEESKKLLRKLEENNVKPKVLDRDYEKGPMVYNY